MAEKMVPSTGLNFYHSNRRGRLVTESTIQHNVPENIQQAKYNSFNVKSARTWNSLPAKFRNMTNVSMDQAKCTLDEHLCHIPDEPHIHSMTSFCQMNSNTIYKMSKIQLSGDDIGRRQVIGVKPVDDALRNPSY